MFMSNRRIRWTLKEEVFRGRKAQSFLTTFSESYHLFILNSFIPKRNLTKMSLKHIFIFLFGVTPHSVQNFRLFFLNLSQSKREKEKGGGGERIIFFKLSMRVLE